MLQVYAVIGDIVVDVDVFSMRHCKYMLLLEISLLM